MEEIIAKNFAEHNRLMSMISNSVTYKKIIDMSKAIINAYENDKKVLIAGNGGSAADSQHIAAELVNRFYRERKALSAIALSTDTSIITSGANDYSYGRVFQRQVEAHGNPGDVFFAISTSGDSKNLVNALETANEKNLTTISLLGKLGGEMQGKSDYEIIVPGSDTPRIQEAHELIYHTICELVENHFLK